MTVVVSLAVYLLVFGLMWWLVSLIPLPAPFDRAVHILFLLILLFVVLCGMGLIPGFSLPPVLH